MTLVLFDVDGTLTATNGCDARCYAIAFERTFGMPLPTTDWNVYKYCTDTGIIHEVIEASRGSRAAKWEIDAFERAFVEALETEFAVNPAAFHEIPGAKAILETLQSREGFAAAIATGGMRGSATYKLSRIGVEVAQYPAAFSNDDDTREGIARAAAFRANRHADDWVYVGDGPWDVRTASAVGMRFVGVSGDASAERLRAAGGNVCVRDFRDVEAFFRAVAEAEVPALAKP